jgi:hypothetical protein
LSAVEESGSRLLRDEQPPLAVHGIAGVHEQREMHRLAVGREDGDVLGFPRLQHGEVVFLQIGDELPLLVAHRGVDLDQIDDGALHPGDRAGVDLV